MILHGDCLDILPTLDADSVDSVVCDPPYGLTSARPSGRSKATEGAVMRGFMGLAWDGAVPGVEIWRECLRVLKPGAYLLAFAGTRTQHRMATAIEDAGFEIRDMIAWVYGSGFPKHVSTLKPALEPITLARKPAKVATRLNIDECRVGDEVRTAAFSSLLPCSGNALGKAGTQEARRGTQGEAKTYVGRWPSNLIHDGSPEVVALFPQSDGAGGSMPNVKTTGYGGGIGNGESAYFGGERKAFESGSGSAARFYYCAKASREDRNEGIGGSPDPAVGTGATMRERQDADWKRRNGNHHPTVKPTDLMRYLCRLVTPPGGLVLDPFAGSGSTGKAAILEGFRFVGIEREAEFVEIARARLEHAATIPVQQGLVLA